MILRYLARTLTAGSATSSVVMTPLVAIVHPVGDFAMQPLAGGEHRRLAGAKLLRLHLAGLEIVADMLADPDLVLALDADLAVGCDFAGLLVDADLVGRQEGVAVSDQHAVGSPAQTCLEIELRPALVGERLHFPRRLLLSRSAPGNARAHRASASMKRSRVIWRRELTKTRGQCQAAFPPILSRTHVPQGAACVARELRALCPRTGLWLPK